MATAPLHSTVARANAALERGRGAEAAPLLQSLLRAGSLSREDEMVVKAALTEAWLLQDDLMPLCQYFAYVEIIDREETLLMASEESGMELWNAYREVKADWKNFAMKRIAQPENIYPVFRELFSKTDRERAAGA